MENKKIQRIVGIISLAVTILYPCFFMYFQNIGEGFFREIGEAVFKFALLACVILFAAFVVLRNFINSVLYTELAMLVLMNFNGILAGIRNLIPNTKKVYFFAIVAVLGILLLFLLRKKKDIFEPTLIIGALFAVLILINFIPAVPAIMNKMENKNITVSGEGIADKVFEGEKPNVYYLFFDEYAGFACLERYYEYGNEEFDRFLQEKGVNVSYRSKNTESLWTSTILPNLLNLSYVASDLEYSVDNFAKTENALMYQLFANNGYSINMINHTGQLYTTGCNMLDEGVGSEDLSDYILEKSIWLEIEQLRSWYMLNVKHIDETDYGLILKNTLNIMQNCADETDGRQPTLTISYICSPHTYFALDEDGHRINYELGTDWSNKSVYLDQLKYVTKCIQNTITNIIEKDPEALIILQSDHGARYPYWMQENHDGPEYDASVENEYMQNILNCVYYKGEEIEIEGMTGINTIRTALNYVFDTDYEMLEPEPIPETE